MLGYFPGLRVRNWECYTGTGWCGIYTCRRPSTALADVDISPSALVSHRTAFSSAAAGLSDMIHASTESAQTQFRRPAVRGQHGDI